MAKCLAVLRVIGWREDTLRTCWLNRFFWMAQAEYGRSACFVALQACEEGRTNLSSVPACRSAVILAKASHPRHASHMSRLFIAAVGVAGFLCGCATVRTEQMTDLSPIMPGSSAKFERLLASPEEFRLQVLVSEVVTNRNGHVELTRYGYRVDAEYFYPASAIKLCAAVAALQAIGRITPRSLSTDLADAPMEIAPLFSGDVAQAGDESNLKGGEITVGHELRKLALVSDNQAFNRFYDLVGHEELNRTMHALGLRSVVINHRLSEARKIPDMRASSAVTFRVPNAGPIVIPARSSKLMLTNNANGLFVGNGYMSGDQVVNTPMDFSGRNGISLVDLQDLLVKVARPDIDLGTPSLRLSETHRARMLQAMTEYPRESANPIYSAKDYPDESSKFLLPGIRRVCPSTNPGVRIEIAGKPGRAYGFSTENSYLRNPANGRAVFVAAVLYTNADGVLNDDKYDYATVADPFFADLGEMIAHRWLTDQAGSPGL